MQLLLDRLGAAATATLLQLGLVLGPLAVCALVLHQLERLTSSALLRTFGYRALLWTGWIGVPVHELSHVAACLLFTHEVEEVKLFSPDPESGRLGFVRHSWTRGQPWAELGRLFIGLAPLFGGALSLWCLAQLLVPDLALSSMADAARAAGADGGPLRAAVGAAWAAFGALARGVSPTDPRWWAFFYLVICVGAHLAPSRSDLGQAAWGFAAGVVALYVVNLVAGFFGGVPAATVSDAAAWTAPAVALLALAALLLSAALIATLLLTSLVERLRGNRGHLARYLGSQWLRLATLVLAAAAVTAGWLGA